MNIESRYLWGGLNAKRLNMIDICMDVQIDCKMKCFWNLWVHAERFLAEETFQILTWLGQELFSFSFEFDQDHLRCWHKPLFYREKNKKTNNFWSLLHQPDIKKFLLFGTVLVQILKLPDFLLWRRNQWSAKHGACCYCKEGYWVHVCLTELSKSHCCYATTL